MSEQVHQVLKSVNTKLNIRLGNVKLEVRDVIGLIRKGFIILFHVQKSMLVL